MKPTASKRDNTPPLLRGEVHRLRIRLDSSATNDTLITKPLIGLGLNRLDFDHPCQYLNDSQAHGVGSIGGARVAAVGT